MVAGSRRARNLLRSAALAAVLVLALLVAWIAGPGTARESSGRPAATSPGGEERVADASRGPELRGRPGASRPGAPGDARATAPSDVTLVANDVRGEPVADVALDVLDDRSEWRDSTTLATATTDAGGRVVVRLAPGPYRVRVRHARFHAAYVQFEAPTAEPVTVPLFVGLPLRVLVTDAEKKPIAGARVREVEIGQGAAFTTGTDGIADLGAVHGVWAAVVVDAPGFLEQFMWAEHAWKRLPAGGQIVVKLQRAAPLAVHVRREGDAAPEPGASVWVRATGGDARGATDVSGTVRFDSAVAATGGDILVTTPDGRRGEARLEPNAELSPRETTVVVAAGRTVAGIAVRSTDGTPVAGAVVFRPWGQSVEWIEATRTDAAGRFRLEHVSGEPGSAVNLRVRAVGWSGPEEYASALPPVRAGAAPNADEEDEPTDDRPPAVRDAALHVVLRPTAAAVGRVLGPDGKPVAGVSVTVASADSTPLALAPLVTRTDALGRYRIEDVPPWEDLAVIAESDGLGVQTTDDTLPDSEDGVIRVPDLVLPGTWVLDVPVVDEEGLPVLLAWLEVRQRVRTRGYDTWRRTVSDGRFHPLPGLSRDGVGVDVAAPGFLPDMLRVDPSTTEIVVNRACRVRGRLVLADVRPLAATDLHLISRDRLSTLEGNEARTKTDAEGRFEAQGLRRGRYQVDGHGGGELVVTSDGQDVGDLVVRGP